MSLLYPLGLIGLIGIPILIIIYILKNKYTEQLVSSTYIWTLSEKFLKRRNPISKLAGIISLILQLLIVIFVSLAIAHPVFIVPEAAHDFCYVLDGSGSMNISQDGKTRFDLGRDKIASLINGTLAGSTYTLIYVDDSTPEMLCKETPSKDLALKKLNELTLGYSRVGDESALGAAQEYFNVNPSVKTYLITDKSFEIVSNVEVINVSAHEENYALSEVEHIRGLNTLTVTGKAISYESDAELDIELYLDGVMVAAQTVEVGKLEYVPFSFENVQVEAYSNYKVVISNPDALQMDSEVVVYNVDAPAENPYDALIVSDHSTFFVTSMLKAKRDLIKYEVIATEDYESKDKTGIELFIFDSYTPSAMPDGEVWFFNPPDDVAGCGFTVQELQTPGLAGQVEYTDDKREIVKTLLKGIDVDNQGNAPYVAEYMKCTVPNSASFVPLVYCGVDPVIFTGVQNGHREVVFAFEFSNADAALVGDFLIIMFNLINYTFPAVLEETLYTCGDEVNITVLTGCESITVKSPSGIEKSLDTDDITAVYTLKEVGEHSITVRMKGSDETRVFYVYSQLPEEERATTVSAKSFNIVGEPDEVTRDGRYEDLLYLFIIIAVLAMADWMVYCYEQYQLR